MGKDKSWKLNKVLKIDDDQLKTPKHDELCLWVDNNIERLLYGILMVHAGTSPKGAYTFLGTNGVKDGITTRTHFQLDWEEPIKGYNNFIIGIPDFKYSILHREKWVNMDGGNVSRTWLFGGHIEVKPTIRSIGETMRQLKLYRSQFINPQGEPYRHGQDAFKYSDYCFEQFRYNLCIVTHSTEYKSLFEKQGFFYITPKIEEKQ